MFFFWAQSLDNIAPDEMELKGTKLVPEETILRQEMVYKVSQVTSKGDLVFNNNDVYLFCWKNYFVLRFVPAQRDSALRKAPVICYGIIPSIVASNWIDKSIFLINQFSVRIGRELTTDILDEIKEALKTVKKKSFVSNYLFLISIVTLLVFSFFSLIAGNNKQPLFVIVVGLLLLLIVSYGFSRFKHL